MVTGTIERRVKIVTLQAMGNRVLLHLSPDTLEPSQEREAPKIPRLEDIIVKEPETEEERLAMRIVRGYMKELHKFMPARRLTSPPRSSQSSSLRLDLTTEEYEKLGKPTVNETLVLKLECTEG